MQIRSSVFQKISMKTGEISKVFKFEPDYCIVAKILAQRDKFGR